jgi:hypothetical protein
VNTVMNIWVPWKVGNFLTSWVTISFSRMTLLHGVHYMTYSKDLQYYNMRICLAKQTTQNTRLSSVYKHIQIVRCCYEVFVCKIPNYISFTCGPIKILQSCAHVLMVWTCANHTKFLEWFYHKHTCILQLIERGHLWSTPFGLLCT